MFSQDSHGRDSNRKPHQYKSESLPLAWLDIRGCISFFLCAYVFSQQFKQIELHLCYINNYFIPLVTVSRKQKEGFFILASIVKLK
jgi:hypothetical protein